MLSATVTVSDADLHAGETAKVIVVFNQTVGGDVPAAVAARNGTLDGWSLLADGVTWTAGLTPRDDVIALQNVVSINLEILTGARRRAGGHAYQCAVRARRDGNPDARRFQPARRKPGVSGRIRRDADRCGAAVPYCPGPRTGSGRPVALVPAWHASGRRGARTAAQPRKTGAQAGEAGPERCHVHVPRLPAT